MAVTYCVRGEGAVKYKEALASPNLLICGSRSSAFQGTSLGSGRGNKYLLLGLRV